MPNLDFHFWLGSLCKENSTSTFPREVIAVSDEITIMEDLGRRVPDNSWMLYLLGFYLDKKEVPVELDLICGFNDDGRFTAVFGGNNQYVFEMPLSVGHSYLREIIADGDNGTIMYLLNDLNTGVSETFELSQSSNIKGLEDISKSFEISNLKDIEFMGTDQFTVLNGTTGLIVKYSQSGIVQ